MQSFLFAVVLTLQLKYVCAHVFFATGSTAQLNNVAYFVPPESVGKAQGHAFNIPNGLSVLPITVINANTSSVNLQSIERLLDSFSTIDDVFQDGFRQVLYVQPGIADSSEAHPRVSQLGDFTIYWGQSNLTNSPTVPNGPYFVSEAGLLHQAYRLYADVQGAFSETIISDNNGSYTVLPANVPGQSLAVAVPSRLYYQQTDKKPLAGVRVGIKDIFDIRGLKTSNGNRAWYQLYPPANTTSIAVQNLIDAGAILVGKMKTSQFANGESATADWVDYHAPFNPRGDGYQDPSSSSAGPAAGIASYEWLDVALGSDTGGSIRSPAQVQGVFGNRPSHGIVSLEGAMPLAPEFDTAGLFARDPRLWTKAARALYGPNMTTSTSYPSRIVTIGFTDNGTSELDIVSNNFLTKVTEFLSADVTPFNLTDSWDKMNPEQPSLLSFINNTYEVLSAKEQARLVRDSFYADYAAANEGRLPHVNPAPLQRWALGDGSSSTIDEGIRNKTIFMDWFNDKILYRDPRTCSNSLILYVPRTPKATSRDTYITGPQTPRAFSTSRIAVMSETPDMVVPIGQVEYYSSITNQTEHLPVTIDILAAKGCDGMVFSLVEDLFAADIIGLSQPGKSSVERKQALF